MRQRPDIPIEASRYPRDMTGYGTNPPDARWPGRAKIAVSSC